MDLENIVIDIMQKNHTVIPSIQYDSNSRFITIKIVTNSKPLDVTNHRVTVACRKPDGKLIFNDCTKVESKIGLVKFEITEQTGAEVGIVKSELRIYGAGNVCLTSQPFNIEITEPVIDAPIVTSSNEFKALTQAMSNLETMADKFDKKYEEVTNQFNNKFTEVTNQFDNKLSDVNTQFNNKFTELTNQFNDKSTELDNKFNDKFTLINQQFNDKSNALDKQFKDKFDNLENQYAVNLAGKVNKTDVSVKALGNTVVRRNPDGNIHNGHAIEFTTINQQKHVLEVVDDAHMRIGGREVWDDGNLPVEKGTFKPYGYGGDNSIPFVHTLQRGTFYRVGKMVTVQGRIVSSDFGLARGHFRIGGLPFRIREEYPACTFGFFCGMATQTANAQFTAYGENGFQFIMVSVNDVSTGNGWAQLGMDKLVKPVDISFSMTYLTD